MSEKAREFQLRLHPRAFAELGQRLVTNDSVAIVELVKNSYDALATRVSVRFGSDEIDGDFIEIEDNGSGMSGKVIKDVWCVVATPYRTEHPESSRGNLKRRASGEKGIGRLCAARLGDDFKMVTKADGDKCWEAKIKWSDLSSVESFDNCTVLVTPLSESPFEKTGTRIRITSLHSVWNEARIEELKSFLSRLVPPFENFDRFKISVTSAGQSKAVGEIAPPKFISKPPYMIRGSVDATGDLQITYEFSAHGKKRRATEKRKLRLQRVSDQVNNSEEAESPLLICGPFNFEIRAWDMDQDSIMDLGKRFGIKNRREFREDLKPFSSVSLYRDNILVLPKTDAGRDWLQMDLRRVSRVGTRLSTSQIVGYAGISADDNSMIQDTADRERLVDNRASQQFIYLMHQILEFLEENREKDRLPEKHKEPPFQSLLGELSGRAFVEGAAKIVSQGGTASDVLEFVSQQSEHHEKAVKEVETRLIYYSRLASIGALSSMILHEVRNQTAVMGLVLRTVRHGVQKLKPTNPDLLKHIDLGEKSLRALDRLADILLPLASRAFATRRRNCTLEEVLSACVEMRGQEFEKREIPLPKIPDSKTPVGMDPGDLTTVVINLIDNALYWVSSSKPKDKRIEFRIHHDKDGRRAHIEVNDTGPGVDPDYEEQIFWPGVTKKPDGGLGMGLTVASELIDQYGGRMALVQPGRIGGASFKFDIPLVEPKGRNS